METTTQIALEAQLFAAVATSISDGLSEILYEFLFASVSITIFVAVRCGVFLPLALARWVIRRRGAKTLGNETAFMNLGLSSFQQQAAVVAVKNRVSLCSTCTYAHSVRGFVPNEELVTCAYSFPPQLVLFKVKECTDYKQKRERIGVGIANEGAVSLPPLVNQAANFHAAAAVRPSVRE
jgi:hypothetical protein